MKDSHSIAETLSALAHPARVDVFKFLLSTHPNAQTAKALTQAIALPPSTLTHHLREMEKGGVIARRSAGTRTLTSLNLTNLTDIASTLMALCCSVQESPTDEAPS